MSTQAPEIATREEILQMAALLESDIDGVLDEYCALLVTDPHRANILRLADSSAFLVRAEMEHCHQIGKEYKYDG